MEQAVPRGEVERLEALEVWLAARQAEGRPPQPARVARVGDKLADSSATLVTVRRHDDVVIGMGLAESFRADGGTGDVRPSWCHVSMVFVRPDAQGRGIGRQVVAQLLDAHPSMTLSLWTRVSNDAATKLYRHHGFHATADLGALRDGQAIRRWERPPGR